MEKSTVSPVAGQEGAGASTATPVPATTTEGTPQGGVSQTVQIDEEARKKIEENIAKKYENDIARIKSSTDKRLDDQEKAYKRQLAEYDERIRKAQIAGMDEEHRKAFEAEFTVNRMKQLEEENIAHQNAIKEMKDMRNWEAYFLDRGVSRKDLNFDNPESLASSGYAALDKLISDLKTENETLKKQPAAKKTDPVKEKPEPPDTLNHSSGSLSKTSNINDLAKKYAGGDVDRLFQMFEKGSLDASLLAPLYKE